MSNYWKKKLDELNEENAKKSSSTTTKATKTTKSKDYWGDRLTELENANKKKKEDEDDIAPVLTSKDKDNAVAQTILNGGKGRDASLWDLTWKSLERGFYNSRYGEESYAAMMGLENEKSKYANLLAEDEYQFAPSGKIQQGVSGAFELLGQQVRQFTNPSSVILAGGMAGTAAVAGQAGPQALVPEEIITVPGAFATGLTMGSTKANFQIEAGLAYNEMVEAGISEETAKKVALGVGGVNASLEMLQVDELVKAFKVTKAAGTTENFTQKILDELVNRGVDIAKETAQEVAQEGVTIAGTQLASKHEKGEWAYNAEDVAGRLADTAVSSALSFGVMNVPAGAKNISGIVSEQKQATALTDNEKKVIDKEYENRINEQEQDGRKLSEKEKSKIYDAVVSDMEKGYISTDTIEEVLGGDTYTAHKETLDREKAMQEEYDTLYKMKNMEKSDEQIDRQAELKKQLDDLKQNFNRNELRDSVMSLVQNDRLAESYNERTRRGQAFEADLTRYDEKQKTVIQRAAESGILNNTNRTHEFVDMIAKISADKGVLFDFTNNERLKESGFAVEGKTVNGFVNENGVSLNIDSAKSLNSVVGHEITHVLEGTQLYTELQKVIVDYAKHKGDYKGRMETIQRLYKGQKNANLEAELTADLVGDYLFTDSDFIHNLSTNHRNVFQKVYDEIKYLCKVATAGSKEARELEKVKRAFEKAYQNKNTSHGDAKYSLSDSDGKQLSEGQQEYFKDSKVRDENGNLKVMYHGTANGGHTIFETYGSNYGLFGSGSYFTDSKEVAEKYTEKFNKRGNGNKQVYETYLNIKNPMDMDAPAKPDEWARAFPDATFPESGTNEEFFRAMEEYFYDEMLFKWEAADEAMDAIIGMGYDGITHIGGGRFNKADDNRHRVYIAFHPEQIKNTDNLNPTEDADIRFSLSESVEETKDLMALHNLTEQKLLKSLELGGLPMPSLAVTKADIPHSNFGEITLIFGKDTIDPKKNKKNKIYSADAWTPVFPRVEYEADSKVGNRISQRLRDLEGRIDDSFQRDISRLQYGFEDYLNSQGGEEGLIQYAMDNYGLKAAYLEEHGKHIDKVTMQKEAEKDFNPDAADKYKKIMDILGVSTAEEVGNVNLKDARDNHGAELEAAYPGITKTAFRMGRVFGAVKSYLEHKDSGPVYNTVTDIDATRKAVDDALDQVGYETWVRDLFAGIVKDSGIYNNKELFTPAGNRRTFKQTHLPVTLENIVKAMAGQNNGNAKNVSGFNGVKTLRASTAETFKSVAEMHQKKGRLQNLTQEQFEEINDSLQNRLFEVIKTIDNETSKHGETNPYIRFDTIGNILTEIGEGGKYNVADIQNIFKQYSRDVNDDIALEVKQLLYDIAQMPVNIFEAKPERVVRFDEAAVFVIPNNADAKLKQELLNRGYSIAEYDPNVEGDRQRVVNGFEEYKFNLSDASATRRTFGDYNVYGKDIAMQTEQDIAPVATSKMETTTEDSSTVAETATVSETENIAPMFPDDMAPVREPIPGQFDSLTDADAPVEMDAPYYGETEGNEPVTVKDPMIDRDMEEVGSPKVKAYMYENPEVKPFFQKEAAIMLRELQDSTKGQKLYNDQLYYDTNGEQGWFGQTRNTSYEIAYLLDGGWNSRGKGYTYAEIEKGLKAIIEDNGKENNACSKRIEFLLNDRLRDGYTDFRDGSEIPRDEGYVSLLNEKQITEYSKEAFDALVAQGEEFVPPVSFDLDSDEPAPAPEPLLPKDNEVGGSTKKNPKGQQRIEPKPKQDNPQTQQRLWNEKTARILPEEPKKNKNQRGLWSMLKEYVLDNGMVFEDLSLKTGNRELQAKWHYIRNARAMAQSFMGKGKDGTRALNDVRQEVEKSGKTQAFSEYVYHMLNVDRMTLAQRYEDMENKPVFGYHVTAAQSANRAVQLEKANPEFKKWAQELYDINTQLREMLVEGNVLSRETADLWAEMYPHYIPIRRAGYEGAAINVALDTNRTGVNAPIKKATGGNRDILPMFDTMGQRTLQTYRAIAKNRFGLELRKTLGSTISEDAASLDSVMDSMDREEGLLTKGDRNNAPTFTVFENGKKYTFEITDEMYESMKPTSDLLAYTNPVLNTASNAFRGLLTEYNPVFMMSNAIKDAQDIIINSQHPARTYMSIPKAVGQMMSVGHYYREYMENGGEENTYFDGQENTFDVKEKGAKKLLGIPPLSWISKANNVIERLPRMAEYIASREDGRSIEVSMLDAARVTTNFAAGGKLTKFANRNGVTFLNASVQGAVQQARNIREAKANGLKGVVHLAAKVAVAGLPAMLVNHLLWDDDEDYEELSDYVKQDYYIVGKTQDGQFVRIPKGRTLAVIQNAFEQMENLATGDDEVDLRAFLELAVSNLAPNNPIENNILAPIKQVAENKTWYGEDLVPTRLADLPKAEQYDESTDSLSKWLGEKQSFLSPYQINYLLDQYSGGVGDVFLPMWTPEAESGDNSLMGNIVAPFKKKFTTDAVMNNQNVSDFYDTKDELTTNAKRRGATDEDVLKSKYINSIGSELSDLYAQKREIQNGNLPDDAKYEAVRDVQKQIVELTKQSLEAVPNVSIAGDYAEVGNRQYRRNENGEWTKVTDKQSEKQEKVTNGLDISASEYWRNKEEYDFAYEKPEKYAVAKSVGGYTAYKDYTKQLNDIKGEDKDGDGRSDPGTRKEKVFDWINDLDADYGTKIILFKNEYNADDEYNYEIINYLNSRDDISGEEMEAILKELGFEVDKNGNVSW